HISKEARSQRDIWIGELRRLLAQSSLKALEPDIVILDEFQRFRNLLDEDDPMSLLANEVFKFKDVKVLMLSATPYKMYSLAWEREEDHYEDFYRTVRFLLEGNEHALADLEDGIQSFREAYIQFGSGEDAPLLSAKEKIEGVLRKIMVRTERLAASDDRDGMLIENHVGHDRIQPRDFVAFDNLDSIARHLGSGDQVEYWKSSAYPLNLMESYKIKRQLETSLNSEDGNGLASLLRKGERHLLQWGDVQAYRQIDPENARLRALFTESIDTGNWKLLWMPPSLPYYRPGRAFKGVKEAGQTKSLVFSAWQVVPKVIAVLASYEAERRMLEKSERDFRYDELTVKRSSRLNFARTSGRLVGMPVFCLTYPSWTLATELEPFRIAQSIGEPKTPSLTKVFRRARETVRTLLDEAIGDWPIEKTGRADDRWYWASLAILDWHHHRGLLEAWFEEPDDGLRWEHMVEDRAGEDKETRYAEHVRAFQDLLQQRQALGKPPRDLLNVLTRIALAGPATSTLRAMLKVATIQGMEDQVAAIASAAKVGLGFRTLFNQPQAISLVGSIYQSGAYWTKVLRYAQEGNLQAVLDEYMHVLHEGLGLMGHQGGEIATKLGETLVKATSLRSPSLAFDEIARKTEGGYELRQHRIRCRYALRFGDEKSEGVEQWTRSADVRVAFNSPFRPFILATTSIGQEGLDFHQYCHRVVHWNIPSNPVDLEQREGRIHRYKGHVIRRNLAKRYGLAGIKAANGALDDPWDLMFARAAEDVGKDSGGIRPYWILDADNGYKIERCIPLLPLSREIGRLEWLKKTLVAYRSVIGQPRQQDLMEFLDRNFSGEEIAKFTEAYAIDLSPPSGSPE
ncbi:MAG: helicase-related protein, partial [Anaerolineales bacterium]